ncbi:phosphatidylserine decarboxylase [Aquipluma nitroreducens]|uniref:Phosphatidylserine decarboxylase n=1 Tax=Aquipluma nitroreducens TaxID=2010828 RepID=A0A5K7S508_9BACT|nr:phosphatidylserine decarboxylase family protein [Aquipluma nitroreducens]BBE16589.1 phosphatidylserine decarboxylase [Aquipluma nitroreducens]
MKFHKAGTTTIYYATAIFAVLILISWFLITDNAIKLGILGAYGLVYFLIIQFFRYPERSIVQDENAIISPADGKICEIKETIESEYLGTKCLQVSIFMSPTNVHINWIPVPGQVTYMKHKDGEFYAAFKDKSAEENERTTTAVKIRDGREIVMKQIAGAMARRIINYVQVGDNVDQTTELGFIRFGSRVDLYLPLGTKLNVKLRDKVKGSQTIIGQI